MQPIRVIYNQAYELLSTKHNTLGQPNLNEPIFSKEESGRRYFKSSCFTPCSFGLYRASNSSWNSEPVFRANDRHHYSNTCRRKFQQACKILNIKRQVLASWLRQNGWDRHLNNMRTSTYYSQARGYCETKYEKVIRVRPNGEQYTFTMIEFLFFLRGWRF